MSETNKDHAEHRVRRLSDGWYAIHFCHECQQEAATDSKKLREPATCNAGHKSNLPLALWDCPVCTQLLRDSIQEAKQVTQGILRLHHGNPEPCACFLCSKAREVSAALGGKAE